jgi:hypothetical protein
MSRAGTAALWLGAGALCVLLAAAQPAVVRRIRAGTGQVMVKS